jgi:pyruvate/2-oxoglutarate dehydrogenase complex dihydrolipoamide dehydrogenase (E3) component
VPDFDVLAIGGGAAGLTIAIGGAGLGLRVALVERHRTGGECTWTGCVPSKALLHAGAVAAAARQAAAWSTDREAGASGTDATDEVGGVRLDFGKVLAHVRGARTAIGEEESPDALRRRGITVLEGTARLLPRATGAAGAAGGHTVVVDGRQVTATHVVIATGSDPATAPIPGLDAVRFFTNESVFDELDALPDRLAVIGGGPIGCELAQAFARLGSRVTLLEAAPRLLMNEDEDVAPVVRAALERDGVVVHTDAQITGVASALGGGRGATLTARGIAAVEADALLVAAGRRARTSGFGLEEAGVALTKNGIEVDEHLQTRVPGVWAIGDCVGPYRFTHVAEMQGRLVLRNILFPWKKQRFDDRVLPWATFTDPEVGHVGLTEAQARERHGDRAEALTFPLSKVDRAVTEGATDGFIKLVLTSGARGLRGLRGQQILGAHIVAPRAGELVQQVALAMQHNLPVSALSMMHVYPAHAYGLHQAGDRAGLRRLSGGFASLALPLIRRLALRAAG